MDVLAHSLDVRWPLGLPAATPHPRVRAALDFLATSPKGFTAKGALAGLRLEAPDLDWTHGEGPSVTGPASALLLVMTGHPAGLGALTGDGVGLLRDRLTPR